MNNTVHLGTFTSKVDAAVAWDEAAVLLRGQKNPLELSRWVLVLNLLDTTVLCDSRKAMIDSQVIEMAATGVSCLTWFLLVRQVWHV